MSESETHERGLGTLGRDRARERGRSDRVRVTGRGSEYEAKGVWDNEVGRQPMKEWLKRGIDEKETGKNSYENFEHAKRFYPPSSFSSALLPRSREVWWEERERRRNQETKGIEIAAEETGSKRDQDHHSVAIPPPFSL